MASQKRRRNYYPSTPQYDGSAVRKTNGERYADPRGGDYGGRPSANRSQRPKKAVRPKPAAKHNADYTISLAVMVLVVFGVVMIFSSSYYTTLTSAKFHNDMFFFLRKQAVWAVLGFGVMFFMSRFNYKTLRKLSFLMYAFSLVCLLLVLFIGDEINGSKRWLGITDSIGFQPSEVAKFALIMFLSGYICKNKNKLNDLKGFLICLAIIAAPAGLTAVANFSTALIIFMIGAVILFVASPKIKYFIVLGGVGAVASAFFLLFFSYRLDRIKIWLDPFSDPIGKGYQIIQGLYAVASGGIFGLGLGQSRQTSFIPEAYNDIIFAIICEELGVMGALCVIGLFCVLIWRGISTAINADTIFGSLAAVGITSMIGVQALINIAVVTNTIPNTGQPLPFISYGGTSLLFTMAAMGVLLNISRYCKQN